MLLDLKPGEKVIVNGTLLECVGQGACLRVDSEAVVLRQREILVADDAVTPASRVYFALQCAYVLPDARADHLAQAEALLGQYVGACPSAVPIAEGIAAGIAAGRLDHSLRHAQDLLRHENMVLNTFTVRLEDGLQQNPDG